MKGYIQSKVKAYQAERRRQRWLNEKLEGLTDPYFLELAELSSDFERANPGIYITKSGMDAARNILVRVAQ